MTARNRATGNRWVLSVALFLALACWCVSPASAESSLPELLVAPHREPVLQDHAVVPGFEQLHIVFSAQFAPGVKTPATGAVRFLSLHGRVLPPGSALPSGGVRLLPVRPGQVALRLKEGLRLVPVVTVLARGVVDGRLTPRKSVALSRSLPPELALSAESENEDEEAVEFLVIGPGPALPSTVELVSRGPLGKYLDALASVPVVSAGCPASFASQELSCGVTPRIRLTVDSVERAHSALSERTVMGEVGGSVLLRASSVNLFEVAILAPEALEPGGVGRYRVELRTRILRTHRGGAPAVGSDELEALTIVREELASTARLWGQCGITLGDPATWDIAVVDPPRRSLLAVGCNGGLPASGGNIDISVDGKKLLVRTLPGDTPERVAERLRSRLHQLGLRAVVHENPPVENAALPSFDLVIENAAGAPARVRGRANDTTPLSSDPTLGVCLVELDLSDGLEHFTDFNAAAGTLEERALLRALMDDDPQTIDLIIVPVFSGLGRIGESFIYSPGISLQNALILDRMGLRAGARSFTLAHELGHVLLSLPGHPDDYGVDTPHSLMDADAADSTIFGPRRLSLAECQRALRQSGRDAPVPLILDWGL